MDNSKFKDAAIKCRECIKECDKVYRLFSNIEDRQWLCEALQDCMTSLNLCASECEIGSMNVRPAIECFGILNRCADYCKYYVDSISTDCRKSLLETAAACNKLFA